MNISEQIRKRFLELDVNIEPDEIERRLRDLTERFKVPDPEAQRSVVSYFLREHGIERSKYYTGSEANQTICIKDVPHEGDKWLNLRVKVVKLWESTSEHIMQTGTIGDETGTIRFVSWANADLPLIEKNKVYSFENIVTNEWQDKISMSFNKTSKITELDEDIEVGHQTTEFTGAMVHIQDGSGLIKRCEICNRALMKGVCQEHGNVDGEHDLRIKAVIDNGITTQDVLFNRERTEELTNITVDDAKTMAMDALDQSVVVEAMEEMLLGRYYTVSGGILDRFLLVETVRPADAMEVD